MKKYNIVNEETNKIICKVKSVEKGKIKGMNYAIIIV